MILQHQLFEKKNYQFSIGHARRREIQGIRFRVLQFARGGHQGSDCHERLHVGTQASVRGIGSEKRGEESSPHRSVHAENEQHVEQKP